MQKNVPKFLDLDLDDQQQKRLLQAWMYSEPPELLSEGLAAVWSPDVSIEAYQPSGLMGAYHAVSQTEFTIQNFVFDCASGSYGFLVPYGEPIAIGGSVCLNDPSPSSSAAEVREEPESAFVEDERVIAFRAASARVQGAIRSGGVRLSSDATQFVVRARGRRLHFEEDPEQQAE